MEFTKELLVNKKVKHVVEKGETYFSVEDLKKKYKSALVLDQDMTEHEIDGKVVKTITVSDIREK